MTSLIAVFSFLIIIIGFTLIFSSTGAWFLYRNRKYKNLEPSKSFYLVSRIRGVILVILGVVILLLEFMSH
ncbi:hypothetical protein D3C86_1881400 [compost metagenome]